jgi:hypothetical protein
VQSPLSAGFYARAHVRNRPICMVDGKGNKNFVHYMMEELGQVNYQDRLIVYLGRPDEWRAL